MLNFLGIGAQKSGTSWLYEKLRRHPGIAFPAAKEVHFWDQKSMLGIEWYRSLFERPELEGKVCGEITPAYSILPIETIRECHANFSDLKLIYLLRNPIERAWSMAKMDLEKAGIMFNKASSQWFIDHFNWQGSLMRGNYETCLRNWLECYPQEQLLVGFFEELLEKPEVLLKKCFRHIEVREDLFDWNVNLKEPVRRGTQADIPPNLRPVLEEIYQPKIEALQDYLGVNLSPWLLQSKQSAG
jgi:hypothetical protein